MVLDSTARATGKAYRDMAFHGPDAPYPDCLINELGEIPDIISRINRG